MDGIPCDDRLTPHRARGASPGILPGQLTLGTDNGSAFTARRFRQLLSGLGIAHRRGGYRDPEWQAFIESWFRYLKERVIWRNEFETIDQARAAIGAYVDHYHDRSTWASITARRGCQGRVRRATEAGGLTCQREAGAVHLIPESTDER